MGRELQSVKDSTVKGRNCKRKKARKPSRSSDGPGLGWVGLGRVGREIEVGKDEGGGSGSSEGFPGGRKLQAGPLGGKVGGWVRREPHRGREKAGEAGKGGPPGPGRHTAEPARPSPEGKAREGLGQRGRDPRRGEARRGDPTRRKPASAASSTPKPSSAPGPTLPASPGTPSLPPSLRPPLARSLTRQKRLQ